MRSHRRTDPSLDGLARWLNPIVSRWINDYGRSHRTALDPLLKRVNAYLRRWAGRKYKRLGPKSASARGRPGRSHGSLARSPSRARSTRTTADHKSR
jgi:hypothetical protein